MKKEWTASVNCMEGDYSDYVANNMVKGCCFAELYHITWNVCVGDKE